MEEEKVVKTPEEIKAAKVAAFNADPDKFFSVDDIIIGCIRTEKGIATAFGQCTRVDMEIALARLTYKTHQAWGMMDVQREMASRNDKRIITGNDAGKPVMSPVDFARGRK